MDRPSARLAESNPQEAVRRRRRNGQRRGVWALFPDKYEGNDKAISRAGAFMATLVAFFLAEIGDKMQIATIGLAVRFEQFSPVVIGTTLGMMPANIPAVLIGDRMADKLPVKTIRVTAAVVFAVLGAFTLAGIGR